VWFLLQTFDECVANDGHDCSVEDLWMQIPFFCGHVAECWFVVIQCLLTIYANET
jgi:hypothetical protein